MKLIYNDEEDCIYCRILSINGKQIESESSFAPKYKDLISRNFECYSECRVLTKDQFQSEVNALGFEYDFKTDTFNESRWEPRIGDTCYLVDVNGRFIAGEFIYDSCMWHKLALKEGRIFKTKSECESAIEKIKNVLKSK